MEISGTQIWISKYIQKDIQSTLGLKGYRKFGWWNIKNISRAIRASKEDIKKMGFSHKNSFKSLIIVNVDF